MEKINILLHELMNESKEYFQARAKLLDICYTEVKVTFEDRKNYRFTVQKQTEPQSLNMLSRFMDQEHVVYTIRFIIRGRTVERHVLVYPDLDMGLGEVKIVSDWGEFSAYCFVLPTFNSAQTMLECVLFATPSNKKVDLRFSEGLPLFF